jgi:hypothetical protein
MIKANLMGGIVFLLFNLFGCDSRSDSKFTEKKVFTITPPLDSFSYLIKAPDSVTVYKLYTKYDAFWNDTIIERGTKQAKAEYHNQSSTEFFSGNYINWTFQKYKATNYEIRLEYYFEYFEKRK